MGKRLQVYEAKDITVSWDPNLCLHAQACVRGLPEVFDPTRPRWIQPDRAPADLVAAAVAGCPTGALRAMRPGTPDTSAEPGAVIRVADGGPLYVRGRVRVERDGGEVILEADSVALCRCGTTANPPFCDGSHERLPGRRPA